MSYFYRLFSLSITMILSACNPNLMHNKFNYMSLYLLAGRLLSVVLAHISKGSTLKYSPLQKTLLVIHSYACIQACSYILFFTMFLLSSISYTMPMLIQLVCIQTFVFEIVTYIYLVYYLVSYYTYCTFLYYPLLMNLGYLQLLCLLVQPIALLRKK